MKETERPAPHADAEVATALKALLIVLLSTVLLPPALSWLLPATKNWQEWEGGQPWTSQDLVQQLEIFLPGDNTDM
jgi:hypothetical protein